MQLRQWASWAFESVTGWKWHRRLRRETGEVYMDRWQLLRSKRLSIYINRINMPDYDPLPHTHPWEKSYSLKLRGSYTEETFFRSQVCRKLVSHGLRVPPRWSRIPEIHRITELTNGKPAWTLFFGIKVASVWGFVQDDGTVIPGEKRKADRGVQSED